MIKIGMRMVKSAVAVFCCFLVDMLRQGAGIPFYSAIAAVLCMQPELSDAKAKGKSRIIATLIGGICGMLTLYAFQQFLPEEEMLLRYAIVSSMMILMIYLPVALHQPSSAYLSCVVFLCVTISHGADENAFLFGVNRIIDTLIGIFVSLGVNMFHLPHHRHEEALLEVPLELLCQEGRPISTYTRVHLNHCIDQHAKLLITSYHTPDEVLGRLKGIHRGFQCLLMDGVLRYDAQQDACLPLYAIEKNAWKLLYRELKASGYYPFVYEVKDEVLYVHYERFGCIEMKKHYEKTRKHAGKHFLHHEQALEEAVHTDALAMMLLVREQEKERIAELLAAFQNEITWVFHTSDQKEIWLLRIYPLMSAEEDIAQRLCEEQGLSLLCRLRVHKGMKEKEAVRMIERAFYKGAC